MGTLRLNKRIHLQVTCRFLPETSCERGNKYLDRSVLVPTVDRVNLAFFFYAFLPIAHKSPKPNHPVPGRVGVAWLDVKI